MDRASSKPTRGPGGDENRKPVSGRAVERIVARAVRSVPGVHDLKKPVAIAPLSALARDVYRLRQETKGVKARIDGRHVRLEIALFVQDGARPPEVVRSVRKAVRASVRGETDLVVRGIDVRVVGVHEPAPGVADTDRVPGSGRAEDARRIEDGPAPTR